MTTQPKPPTITPYHTITVLALPFDAAAILLGHAAHGTTPQPLTRLDRDDIDDLIAQLEAARDRITEITALTPGERYRVNEAGGIENELGDILYDPGIIADLSQDAKIRLAQLHTADQFLAWYSDEGQPGAREILIKEGLIPDELPAT